jgi:hypothetical protein
VDRVNTRIAGAFASPVSTAAQPGYGQRPCSGTVNKRGLCSSSRTPDIRSIICNNINVLRELRSGTAFIGEAIYRGIYKVFNKVFMKVFIKL